MTIQQAEDFLEEKYAKYYIDPFARVSVSNRRIVVFSGNFSEGKVVELGNRNMTLTEGLALAGGIPRSGKAHTIQLIRGSGPTPDVYHIDLSKIDYLDQASIVLQSNDIIYVQPRISIVTEALREWAPIIAVTTSVLTLYILIISL